MAALDVDWSQLEAEYIAENISYAKLAERHGLKQSVVRKYGARGQWKLKRDNLNARAYEECEEHIVNVIEAKKDRLNQYLAITDKLAEKIADALDAVDPHDAISLRALAGAVKDLRISQGLNKTALDLEEQQARIDAYRARAALVAVDSRSDDVWCASRRGGLED